MKSPMGTDTGRTQRDPTDGVLNFLQCLKIHMTHMCDHGKLEHLGFGDSAGPVFYLSEWQWL